MRRFRFRLLSLSVFFFFSFSGLHPSRSLAEILHGTAQDDLIIATASYEGIISYGGDDTLINSGTIDMFAFADADSNSVTATLNITSLPKSSGPSAGVQGASPVAGAASDDAPYPTATETGEEPENLIDVGTLAEAFATGIDGGDGTDKVFNTRRLIVRGESDADSVSVNPTINLAKGGLLNVIPGMSLAESGTTARTVSTGIDGGAGDGGFCARIDGDGSHGQLAVMGETRLAGDLDVIKGPGVFKNGARYDILLADNLAGDFSGATLPEEKPLLSFQTTTRSDRVEVEARANSCTTVAANSLQMKIAQHLDQVMPTASGDMSRVLGDFQALSEPDFDAAFESLSPDSYNNATRSTLGGTRQYVKTIQQRMHSLRAGLGFAAANARPGYGVWVQGFWQRGDQDGEDGFTGYDYDLYGGTLGADRFLNDRMLLGISLGASSANPQFSHKTRPISGFAAGPKHVF